MRASADSVDGDGRISILKAFSPALSWGLFSTDSDYRSFAEARIAGSQSLLYAIDGTDVAGTTPYLPRAR